MSSSPKMQSEPQPAGKRADDPVDVVASTVADLSGTLPLLEETLHVSKRSVESGTVRVSTRTETYDDVAEVTLDRTVVEVTRVPVGKIVEFAPSVRTDGNMTIVPVIEERFVVVKQLYVTEELHIRHHIEQETSRTPVQLRRQTAVVERFDADGHVLDDPILSSNTTRAEDPAVLIENNNGPY